jgi:hypothetical protein
MNMTFRARLRLMTALIALPTVTAFGSEDRTIWLQPGHCIVVGSQQVCAVKPADGAGTDANAPKNRQMHLCKNGLAHESDTTLKGWAHVIVTVNPDGKKIAQEVIKTYGPLGKKDCEADVAKEQSQQK